MIIYTPLDIPKIEPNNWDEWWDVWNIHSQFINKVTSNHNNTVRDMLRGFDIFNTGNTRLYSLYDAVMAPKCKVVHNLLEQIFEHVPLHPRLIRVMENTGPVPSHSDYASPRDEFRAVLWNTYTDPIWEFTYKDQQRKLTLPSDTNSFYYKDYPLQHSAIYDKTKTKGLLLVYGPLKKNHSSLIKESASKYQDYAWIQ